MPGPKVFLLAGLGVILALGSAGVFWAMAQNRPDVKTAQDRWRPRWAVGDQWVIETASRPITARSPEKEDDLVKTRWQFSVVKREKLIDHDCFVIEVTALKDPKAQPRTTLWVDAKALALRQFQTQIPVPGGFTTITESYDSGRDAPASPVIGPLTALPVDLPVFVPGAKAEGEQVFSYEAVSGPSGKRAPSDVGFAVEIRQTVSPVALDSRIKGLVPQEFSRDLEVKPLAEVRMRSAERSVRQIWQAGQPWPVYADSGDTTTRGDTTSRLVEVKPGKSPR